MKFTVAELAEQLHVEEPAAKGLVVFLLDAKLARFRGERPGPVAGRKGLHVYEIAGDVLETIHELRKNRR